VEGKKVIIKTKDMSKSLRRVGEYTISEGSVVSNGVRYVISEVYRKNFDRIFGREEERRGKKENVEKGEGGIC